MPNITLDLNNHLDFEDELLPSDSIAELGKHRYQDGILEIKVTYRDGNKIWMDAQDL